MLLFLFFLTSLRGCVKVLFFFFSSLPLRTSLPAVLLMNSSSDFLCRLVFFYLQVPIAMLSSDFSFEFALLRVSSDSALPTFLFRFSSSECLFRLSLRLPPLRFWLLTFNFWLLIVLLFMFFFRQAFAVLYKSLFCISLLIFLPTFLFCLSLRELVFATWSLRFRMLRDGGGWDSSVADLIAALVPLMDPKP